MKSQIRRITRRIICLAGAIALAGSTWASAQLLPDRPDRQAVQAQRTGVRLATRNDGKGRIVTRLPSRIATRLQNRLDNSYRVELDILRPLEQSRSRPPVVTTR